MKPNSRSTNIRECGCQDVDLTLLVILADPCNSEIKTTNSHHLTSTSAMDTHTDLDAFFPLPSEEPSTRSPARLAGITRESSEGLLKVLKDNHVKWHAFFNDKGFHK